MTIIEQTKAGVKRTYTELEKLRKEKDKKDFSANVSGMKSRTRQSFNKMYDNANPVDGKDANEGYVLPRKLKRGDTVYVVDLQRKGNSFGRTRRKRLGFRTNGRHENQN